MLLNYNKHKKRLASEIDSNFPLFFQYSFAQHIDKQNNQSYHLFYSSRFKAYLPFILVQSSFLKIARYADIPCSKVGLNDSEKCIVCDEFIQYCKDTKTADRITFHLPFKTFPTYVLETTFCKTGHYEVNLKSFTIDEVFDKGFKSKTKNMIRKGIKEGVIIKEGDQLFNDFYKLYEFTNTRSNAFTDSYTDLHSFFKTLGDSSKIFCAYHNEIPQSATFIALHGKEAYYLFAGSTTPIIQGSTNLLQYKVLQYLKEKGVETYYLGGVRLKNVEGTKYKGIQKFKESIGGKCTPGYLWKTDISKLKCNCYDQLLSLKLRIKGTKPAQDYIDNQR